MLKSLAIGLLAGFAAIAPFEAAAAPPSPSVFQQKPEKHEAPQRIAQLTYAVARSWLSSDGKTIALVGKLENGAFLEFAELLRKNPKVTGVLLASPGGSVNEGYLIANAVRMRNLKVRVDHTCMSSCTLIFAAGSERLLGPKGQLGFHQTYVEDGETGKPVGTDYGADASIAATLKQSDHFDLSNAGDARMARALRRANVSDEFIGKVLRTSPEDMWFPSSEELIRERMVTRVVTDADGAVPRAGETSAAAVEAAMQESAFWRALKDGDSASFDAAATTVWQQVNSGAVRREIENLEHDRVASGLAKRYATASDEVLDQFLTSEAEIATIERGYGFPECDGRPAPAGNAYIEKLLDHREARDGALIALLRDQRQVPRYERTEAQKIFKKNFRPLQLVGPQTWTDSGDEAGLCRRSMVIVEAIQQLDQKRRLTTFRALLSLD